MRGPCWDDVSKSQRSGAAVFGFPAELEIAPLKLGEDWSFSAFIRDITEAKLAAQKVKGKRTQPAPND